MTATVTAPASGTYLSLRAAWIPLLALCLAFFVEMVDNTLLGIALPTIGRDLGGNTTALQWVTGAYSLTFGGLLLSAGSAADRLGRRRVLQVGLALFGLLSLLVIWVDSIQALRMRAITLMIVVGMSGFILGPLLGGTALGHVRWEWLLVVNAPIALIAFIGVRLGVAADDPDGLTRDKLDLPGALASIVTIGLACYTATSGADHGWGSPATIASGIGALAALSAFIWHERRTPEPMLDLAVFGHGTVRGATLAQTGTAIAMAGVMF